MKDFSQCFNWKRVSFIMFILVYRYFIAYLLHILLLQTTFMSLIYQLTHMCLEYFSNDIKYE